MDKSELTKCFIINTDNFLPIQDAKRFHNTLAKYFGLAMSKTEFFNFLSSLPDVRKDGKRIYVINGQAGNKLSWVRGFIGVAIAGEYNFIERDAEKSYTALQKRNLIFQELEKKENLSFKIYVDTYKKDVESSKKKIEKLQKQINRLSLEQIEEEMIKVEKMKNLKNYLDNCAKKFNL